MPNFIIAILFIVLCEGAGFIGSFVTFPAITGWYQTLIKPSFNPPNWIFGPVWTLLYAFMGIALYLVWKEGLTQKSKTAIIIFAVQLILNILWSYLFFYFKSPGLAFIEIIVLWFAILLTIVKFYAISKPAGLILIPYLAWVSFASLLNFYVFKLNP
jgi:translocator protein